MKINKTKDYSKFKSDPFNREVSDTRRVQKIAESMEKFGWIPSFPINVKKDGPHFIVRDGQHRLRAAQSIGIDILYVVDESAIDIAEVNSTQKNWSVSDYVGSYAARGNPDYNYLAQFSKRTGISPMTSAGLLYNNVDGGNVRGTVIRGGFQVRNAEYAELVAGVYLATVDVIGVTNRAGYLTAISRCCTVKEFDRARYIKSVTAHPGLIRNMSVASDLIKQIEYAYNYRKCDRVPLATLVDESMARRRAVKPSSNSK